MNVEIALPFKFDESYLANRSAATGILQAPILDCKAAQAILNQFTRLDSLLQTIQMLVSAKGATASL